MREGVLAERDLPDGRNLSIQPLTFGRARLVISPTATSLTYDDGW